MFRIQSVDAEGIATRSDEEREVAPPAAGSFRWIDLSAQDDPHLALLADRFPFHPLTIEDCAHFDQRPKVEAYGEYLFLVLHGFRLPNGGEADAAPLELHMFLGRNYFVTVHAEPIPALEAVWKRVANDPSLLQRGPDFVCYLASDALIDAYFPALDEIALKVDQIEDRVLDAHHEVELGEIFHFKRLLVQLRKVLSPQRDVLALLAKRGDGWIAEHTALYFRDVYDHALRLHESVEATRDLLSNALDAYLWAASQRTNEIVKRLTLLSAIFLPLAFITGFFGQNFTHLPFDNVGLLSLMLVSCIAVPAGMVYYFIRSKWF